MFILLITHELSQLSYSRHFSYIAIKKTNIHVREQAPTKYEIAVAYKGNRDSFTNKEDYTNKVIQ